MNQQLRIAFVFSDILLGIFEFRRWKRFSWCSSVIRTTSSRKHDSADGQQTLFLESIKFYTVASPYLFFAKFVITNVWKCLIVVTDGEILVHLRYDLLLHQFFSLREMDFHKTNFHRLLDCWQLIYERRC